MKKEDLWKVYNHNYANSYNERFLTNPFSRMSLDFELNVLKGQINKGARWLDLGCGTGYFLSQFPGIERAGLDISPEMLEYAKKVNPDASFLKEGDFREKTPEWNNKWSLISCMWGAYMYVDSLQESELVFSNMINWTSEGGAIFLPVMDMEDIRPNNQYTYREQDSVYEGSLLVTSFTWTWIEKDSGLVHENMVAPHIEHIIEWLKPFFETIEVVRYPPYRLGWVSRKAILAKGKKAAEQGNLANVIWNPIPAPFHSSTQDSPVPSVHSPAASLSHKQLINELTGRVLSGRLFKAIGRKLFS